MSDLAEFLLARIAEDEEMGHLASQMGWRWVTVSGLVIANQESFPARVLAECEAKRRIVELHKLVTEDYSRSWWASSMPNDPRPSLPPTTGCDHCRHAGVDGEEYLTEGPCPTLQLLALPYADHPDYREEWKR